MNQTALDSDVFYFPQEVIRNILKRLQVKSLIRFQCVCKDWKNLIQNPSFIADHLQQSSHENPSLLLECTGINIPLRRRLILLDRGLQFRAVQNSPSNNSLKNANIVGSCNGLLCLKIHQLNQSPYSLALWNPATSAVRHVPRTRTDFSYFDECVIGFGFSPVDNDYKIVKTFAEFYAAVARVELFSLSRGTWKVIDFGNLKGVTLGSETVTANGAIFWCGVKPVGADEEGEENIEFQEDEDYTDEEEDYTEEAEDEVGVIVSFDIAKEVFTVIPRPNLDYNAHVKLTLYENKLAMLCDICEDDYERPYLIDLWVLDEGTCASGQTWSWTKRWSWSKRCTSRTPSCALDTMTVWRDKIVYKPKSNMCDHKGRRNVLWTMNLSTNKVKSFVIPYHDSIRSMYDYVESLVSVGNNDIGES